jgi:hypothetical protein
MLKFNRVHEFGCKCHCAYTGYTYRDTDNPMHPDLNCDCHYCREFTETFFQDSCNSDNGKGWHFKKGDFGTYWEEWMDFPEYLDMTPVLIGELTGTVEFLNAEDGSIPDVLKRLYSNLLESGK